jgi:diaminohydroxyphosphoribosylaminopyrimidine deaminase/5-amino-6-(5-phosphoribosylamino)uracil reductase
MQIDDKFYMNLAIKEAWKYQLLTYPNPAVGAVVLDKNGAILSIEAHKEAGLPHAEIEAIKGAYIKKVSNSEISKLKDSNDIHNFLYENHNNLFKNDTLYVTLEPCNHYGKTPPCSLLIAKLGFKRVVVAIKDKNKKAKGGISYLKKSGIDISYGVLKKEAKNLLYPFYKWQKNNFIFFKLAQRLNGSIDGGYITSKESLELVHKLRDKIDLLAIGGNTVRVDRPTLDTRFIKDGRNPNILIYSKNRKIDKNIPLFKIENRYVSISKNLNKIKKPKFVMIEGGSGMIESTKNITDLYLFFISPKSQNGLNIELKTDLEFLYQREIGEDLLIFAKPR